MIDFSLMIQLCHSALDLQKRGFREPRESQTMNCNKACFFREEIVGGKLTFQQKELLQVGSCYFFVNPDWKKLRSIERLDASSICKCNVIVNRNVNVNVNVNVNNVNANVNANVNVNVEETSSYYVNIEEKKPLK